MTTTKPEPPKPKVVFAPPVKRPAPIYTVAVGGFVQSSPRFITPR